MSQDHKMAPVQDDAWQSMPSAMCHAVVLFLSLFLALQVCSNVWRATPPEPANTWTRLVPFCTIVLQVLVGLLFIVRWYGGTSLCTPCFELSCWITKVAFLFWLCGNTCGLILPDSSNGYVCLQRLYMWFLVLAFGMLLLTIPLGRYLIVLFDERMGNVFVHPWCTWTLVCAGLLIILTFSRSAASVAMTDHAVTTNVWYMNVPPPFSNRSIFFPIIDGLLVATLGGIYLSFMSMAFTHASKSNDGGEALGSVWARAHLLFLLFVVLLIFWHCTQASPRSLFSRLCVAILCACLLLLAPLCFPWQVFGEVLHKHSDIMLSAPTDVTVLCIVSLVGSISICYYGYATLNQSLWMFIGFQFLLHLVLALLLLYLQHSQGLLCVNFDPKIHKVGRELDEKKLSQYLLLYMGLYLFVVLEGLAPYEQGGLTQRQKKRAFALTIFQAVWLGILLFLYLTSYEKGSEVTTTS